MTDAHSTQDAKIHIDAAWGPGPRIRDRLLVSYARGMNHPAKLRMVRALSRWLNPRPLFRLPSSALFQISAADYIGSSILWRGSYEPRSLRLASRLMREAPGLFVDVGANLGLFTLNIATLPGTTVLAIEPDCAICTALRSNIALNKLENVRVFNGGVGATHDVLPIAARSENNAGTTFTGLSGEQRANWVPVLPLDTIIESIIGKEARPRLMKMDIEGAEKAALDGIDWLGPLRPQNIILEFNIYSAAGWDSFGAMRDFFVGRGYSLHSVDGNALEHDCRLGDLIEDNIWLRDTGIR